MNQRIIVLSNAAPRHYAPARLGDEPVLLDEQPAGAETTTIEVSPDSTLLQAIAEVQEVWRLHSHDAAPTAIRHSPAAAKLAALLADEWDVTDVEEIAS